jgi:peptide/nickel transport system substrate-binding protein
MIRRSKPVAAVICALVVLGVSVWAGDRLGGSGPVPSRRAEGSRSQPVLRAGVQDFGFTGAFDPVGEYLGTAWGLYSQLLLRTLVTYRHVAGPEGTIPVPDLAIDTGGLSADGLTYTFHLKPGLSWGPPLSRPITSRDVAFAFQRIDSKKLVAQYGSYYDGTIVGMSGAIDKTADQIHIPGIETPDDRTVVFHLERPTGDFLHRLALPAAAPVPPEVAGCFRKAGEYGQYLISSGPYMIRGADGLDASSCGTLRPLTGYSDRTHLDLVRNPHYDPSTDDPGVRVAGPREIDIEVVPNESMLLGDIATGRLDVALNGFPTQTLESTTSNLDVRLRPNPSGGLAYLSMNLLLAPFDDIHVRRAVALVVDRSRAVDLMGGSLRGRPATHLFDPLVFPRRGAPDQFVSTGGDVTAARAEIARSRYDRDGDGQCDPETCSDLTLMLRPGFSKVGGPLAQDLASIGIRVRIADLSEIGYSYVPPRLDDIALAVWTWTPDYPDPVAFAPSLSATTEGCELGSNLSNLGMSMERARLCGVLPRWRAADIPNLGPWIARCQSTTGDERTACWAGFDLHVTNDVVPWVPLIWLSAVSVTGPGLERFDFDQFSGMIAICHASLRTG